MEIQAETRYKLSYASKVKIKYALAYSVLGVAMLIAIGPIVWTFITSINSSNDLLSTTSLLPKHVSFKNYESFLFGENSHFFLWFRNSFLVAMATVVLSLAAGCTAAYAYSRYEFVSKKTTLSIFILLNAFPNIMALTAYIKILSLLHLSNLWGLVIIYTGGQLVFTIWNLKSYFDTIPIEIEESAYMDGASVTSILTKIILPLSRPAIAVTALFSFMAGWNEYVVAVTVANKTASYTLPVGMYSLQNVGDYAKDWPLFSAGSLVVAVPVMIIFLFLQKSLVSGLTLGSSK